MFREQARTPVRDNVFLRRRHQGRGYDLAVIEATRPPRAGIVFEAGQPVHVVAGAPGDHRRPRHPASSAIDEFDSP
ncbi:hypothetical protein A0W34_30205 (plasmid) [Rhodococcus sp. BH4]|nr:hypothetical protein A0W34_30205 [Rhodococcus sp. BH4]